MLILLVEDDTDLSEAVQAFLERNRFTVEPVFDGRDALESIRETNYDAVILDIMLPGMNGVDVLKTIRAEGRNVPVMMLTARGELEDRILGFDSGADDYLPKPFDPDELIARLRAILRRRDTFVPEALSYEDLTLDKATGEAVCGENRQQLSGRESQILELLMQNPGTISSVDRIMDRVWGWNNDVDTNAVWVHISNLRKKLRQLGTRVTVSARRGLGYVLEVKADD